MLYHHPMEGLDPYKVLGLTPWATRREVETRYLELVAGSPPPPAPWRREIDRAYILLSDPRKKEAFDRSRGYRLHPGLAVGSPARARRHYEMGRVALEKGQARRAHRFFRLAASLQPWEAVYRSYLGLTKAILGHNGHRARELCREAVRLDPECPVCRRNLSLVYRKLGFRKRARLVLERERL